MAKNKKRKANEYQQQKIEQAQRKKLFLFKLRGIINITTGKYIYEKIPKKYLDSVYDNRNFSVLIKPAEGQDVSKEKLNEIISLFLNSMKDHQVRFTEDDRYMTIKDFFTVCLSIIHLESIIKVDDFFMARYVKDELKKISNNDQLISDGLLKLAELMRAAGIMYSNLQKQLYYFTLKVNLLEINGLHIQHTIFIYCQKPEISYVKIKKEFRPVIRFGLAENSSGISWVSIKPSQLNMKNTFADLPHDVYIQSHALIRLKERLDCMDDSFILFTMYMSINYHPKLCYDKYNNMMLEYNLVDEKLGYLPIEITDGKIIIKTFLFVTNNSTPEGEILEKYTGFQKEEKRYLGIDKLSTFMSSDIGENKELQQFLRKSGCQCLIDLYEKHKNNFTVNTESHNLNKMMELVGKNSEHLKELEI